MLGNQLTLDLTAGKEGPGLNGLTLLAFLGGQIGIPELLHAHFVGWWVERRERDHYLLEEALKRIRRVKQYYKRVELAEAAKLIEAALSFAEDPPDEAVPPPVETQPTEPAKA